MIVSKQSNSYFRMSLDPNRVDRCFFGAPVFAGGVEISLIDISGEGKYNGKEPVSFTINELGEVLDVNFSESNILLIRTSVYSEVKDLFDARLRPLSVRFNGNTGHLICLKVEERVDCIDEKRSILQKSHQKPKGRRVPQKYAGISKLIVDQSRICEDTHLLQVKYWPAAFIVSERFMKRLKKINATGVAFTDVTS